jgi:hypothetical protein
MKFSEWIVVLMVMAVFLSFVGIPTGITSVMEYYGVNITSSELVSADIENSGFFDYLFNSTTGILAVLIGGGLVIIGFFAKSYDTSLIIIPIIVSQVILFIGIFWSTIAYVMTFGQSWLTAIVGLILIGMLVGFIWSAVDYFAGR